MVNQQVLEGHWHELKGRIQERWSQLTDDELRGIEGNVNQLVGLIQRKTGEGRKRIEAQLEELTAGTASLLSAASETVRNVANQASERIAEGYEQVAEHVREGYDHAHEVVHRRPMESVAAAFGTGIIAGVVAGLILTSRR